MSIFSKLLRQGEPQATVSFRNRGEQFTFTKGGECFDGECAWAGHHNNKVVLFASTIQQSGASKPLTTGQQTSIAQKAKQALEGTGPAYSVEVAA